MSADQWDEIIAWVCIIGLALYFITGGFAL